MSTARKKTVLMTVFADVGKREARDRSNSDGKSLFRSQGARKSAFLFYYSKINPAAWAGLFYQNSIFFSM